VDPVNMSISSVGIDIGSTTTQLVFSRLVLGYPEGSQKLDVVCREITYLSPVSLTPFTGTTIDEGALSSLISSAYTEADQDPEDVETGAIIITGVAATRENARRITGLFAERGGRFVCATAGPNYEAVLAAHGSGAVLRSSTERSTVMNVDVGGGTTKLAVVRNGEVMDTASLYVGARHVVLDESDRLVRVERPAELVAESVGLSLEVNEVFPERDQRAFAASLAGCLFEVMERGSLSLLTESLLVTPPLSYAGGVDAIFFSGGVSEYIYGRESRDFGDLGRLLGEEIMRRAQAFDVSIEEPAEGIRATVIGESQYTLQVSGSTTLISNAKLLPLRNLPVVSPKFQSVQLSEETMTCEIRRAMELHDLRGDDAFALAFSREVISRPSYELMQRLCRAIYNSIEGCPDAVPVVLVFEADIGMGMGRVFSEEVAPGRSLVSIDEIKLHDFNFVDIGEPSWERGFIPVVVKSLVFPNGLSR